jgi:hypothetical protein
MRRCLRHHLGMDEAFIIMQIGDSELDATCDKAMVPAIEAAGFAARRVDRHNAGDLLKSEIVQFLERSQIIVADLTNERPNCYLEIGYAMGLGKKPNLILTAREDHHHSSRNFRADGPRVHFDLEGYDILFWNPEDLASFREELTNRIKRRAGIIQSNASDRVHLADTGWRDELRAHAIDGLETIDRHGYMEVVSSLRPAVSWAQPKLLDAVREAEVHTFGWPIAVTLDNRDEYRPRPTTDGIVADIAIDDDMTRKSYDFWKLFRDGRFYTLLSLFEDERRPNTICWDIRTIRATEALLFLTRLYRRLNGSDTDEVTVSIRHGGLANRLLGVANSLRFMGGHHTTSEDAVETTVTASLIDLEVNITDYIIQLINPLLVVFDFYKVSDQILTQVAEEFIGKGREAA